MRKKVVSILCLVLLLGTFASTVSIASAGKQPLERRVFIHYRKGYGKPDGTPGKGPPPKDEDGHSDHYELLGKGVKWKSTPVSLVIDPDNPDDLPEAFLVAAIFASAEQWDAHTETELFSNSYTIDYESSWDSDAPDERNEILFGDYGDSNVIAVTVIWGYFSGPPGWRAIIEFDILFNTDFTWGDATTLEEAVMDLQNIATHELGHGAGLGDLYYCELETMYGYASYDEIIKRDLHDGDIAGIKELYQ